MCLLGICLFRIRFFDHLLFPKNGRTYSNITNFPVRFQTQDAVSLQALTEYSKRADKTIVSPYNFIPLFQIFSLSLVSYGIIALYNEKGGMGMAFQSVFKRYELKYLLTIEQQKTILEAMSPYMDLDKYGKTTIRNIYFDTDHYRLIRRSIEKPAYKEKLRIRSYSQATSDSTVFVELKKKYQKLVYKRRVPLCESDAMAWVSREKKCPFDTQISREIDYFIDFYGKLRPMVFLSYERAAYYNKSGGDFRVTFDNTIRYRQTDISLCASVYGESILPEGMVLMELKCSGGIPLWMTEVLSRERIYKTSFSKYGTAYSTMISPEIYRPIP